MPINKNYTIYFVYGNEEKIFPGASILPSIPPRFAIVENTTTIEKGTEHRLLCLCDGDKALHFLALLGLGNEITIHGSPAYYDMDNFIEMAKNSMIVPPEVNL